MSSSARQRRLPMERGRFDGDPKTNVIAANSHAAGNAGVGVRNAESRLASRQSRDPVGAWCAPKCPKWLGASAHRRGPRESVRFRGSYR